jgi:serine/threonine-protein kinase
VVQDDLRFERTRSLELEAGRTYEAEIRARRGFLEVRVFPWARVTVDGKALGLTPFRPLSLYEGVHEVVLEHPEHGRRAVSARVVAGETEVLEVRLAEE